MKYKGMKVKSYSDFWNEKGDYGKKRVKRMIQRKQERHNKRLVKVEQRSHLPWNDPSSPTGMSQNCCWRGICQYPCNGDC